MLWRIHNKSCKIVSCMFSMLVLVFCLSTRREEFKNRWKDFHESWVVQVYWSLQFWLKSDNNIGRCTWRPTCICVRIPSLTREIFIGAKNVSHRSCRENWNMHFISNAFFFVSRTMLEIIKQNWLLLCHIATEKPVSWFATVRAACFAHQKSTFRNGSAHAPELLRSYVSQLNSRDTC
jgi:hypothetical protein